MSEALSIFECLSYLNDSDRVRWRLTDAFLLAPNALAGTIDVASGDGP